VNPGNIIIDSSVAAKWYLPDEKDINALKIKADFTDKAILITIPILFYYEVSNILKTTSKALRISKEIVAITYQDLLKLDFTVYYSNVLFKAALEKALELDISSYDASYIALAEYLEVPFYSADDRLIKKANHKLVVHLKDYHK